MNQVKNRSLSRSESFLETGFNLFIVFFIITVLLSGANNCLAVNSFEEFHTYLTERGNFTDSDLANLESGRFAAKLLDVSNKREVAVFGIAPINTSPELALQSFQQSLLRQNQGASTDFGTFGSDPVLSDLDNLILEDKDIEDLKKCQVSNCKVKLSAEMIGRFQKEIDWNASDYAKQATLLFRNIILEYVRNYLLHGNSALIQYNDKREVVRVEDEQHSLLSNLLWINDTAPEFYKYLQNFPHSEPKNITKSISWAKVKFGLKPVIIITQTITYQPENSSQVLSVTKQLYANHYFDSSLGLAAFVKFPSSASYMLYINHSRSDALGGILGKMARGKVEKEALAKLETLLHGTRYYAETNLNKQNSSAVISGHESTVGGIFSQNYLVLFLILLVVSSFVWWFGKQFVKSRPVNLTGQK